MTMIKYYLKTSAFAVLAALLLNMGCTSKQKESTEETEEKEETVTNAETVSPAKAGVQIYSVRDALKDDFEGTIKKIAEMGYAYIEGYGMDQEGNIYGMPAAEYKRIIEENGMQLISCHTSYFTPEQAPKIIETAQAIGLKYVIIPYLTEDMRSDYHAIAANLNAVGEMFKDTGVKFGYHNHAFEFEKQGEDVPLEILLEETNPEHVTFQLDLYWVVKGGFDPMDLINRYPGRFTSFHVKDAAEDLEQTTLGAGTIDFTALLNARETAGLEYYFIEDERTDDPIGNLKADIEHIRTLDF